MSTNDDQFSEVTASSSGIRDCHVTILSDEKVYSLASRIEEELRKNRYLLPIPPAGRRKLENRISQIKHSTITVVLFTKKDDETFRTIIQDLSSLMSSTSLCMLTTVILYENEVQLPKCLSERYVHLLFRKDPAKTARLISGYIEAFKIAKDYNATNLRSFREFYAELLLNSIINPLNFPERLEKKYNALTNEFLNEYGAFKRLLVGGLKQRLEKSESFILQGDNVWQSDEAALKLHRWHFEITSFSSNVRAPIPKLSNQFPKVSDKTVSCESSTNEKKQFTADWVLEQPEEKSNSESWYTNLDWEEVAPLQKLLPEISLRYSFFLINGKHTPPDCFKGISNIPWLKVFDFDVDSESNGLFSSIENNWKEKRYCFPTTPLSSPKLLSTKATEWFYPLGYSRMPDTLCTGSPLTWFNDNKASLEKQFSDIANFCAVQTVPVFLILWYDPDMRNVKYLTWILSVLYPAFKCNVMSKQIILCTEKTASDNSSLQVMIADYELENATINIRAETVYKWLARQPVTAQPQQDVVRLPKIHGEFAEIYDKSWLLWIQQYIEILPLEPQDKIASRKTEHFGEDFLKGNVISWDELASNSLAVQRDGKKDVFEYLRSDVIKKQKSLVLKIQHAPGGGGTTFARQLLWDLHFLLPCGVVIPNLTLSIAQISEGVRHLYDRTKLPVVLLIDGHSEFEIDQIFENCKYAVVILHVQRCSKQIPKNEFKNASKICRLPGLVTINEASNLTEVFSSFSFNKETLEQLTNDVRNSKVRFVFEYGLAAFHHEFKGVRQYVKGYLTIPEQKTGVKHLLGWQRVVGYLSLALYYGQSGVNRETFRCLLKVKKFVSLKHLGYSGSQFIIETEREWKISYNIVAKEILEQILSSCSSAPTDLCFPELSPDAKINLHELVNDFILLIKDASKGNAPETLIILLTNMIIRRDYSEVDKSDGITKAVHSKLLEDIPKQQNRVLILQNLTKSFPRNAEFHAHLGRLLNITKNFVPAEKSLQTALEIRLEECVNVGPDFADDMLSRIHHMFGVGYSLRVQEEQRSATKDKYQNMLKFVKKAVIHFGEARRHTTHNLSYGCIGEVKVRLLLAEFVQNKFSDGCEGAFNFKLGKKHFELSEFVRESHSMCDRLLAECLQYYTEQELQRVRTYTKCIDMFNSLYGSIRHEVFSREQAKNTSSISLRRSQIASLKMSKEMEITALGSRRPCLDNVQSQKNLQKIITLYESIIQQVIEGGNKNESISVDVLEWLEAVRHPLATEEYSFEHIKQIVRKWEKRNEYGYATFYLYVVNYMLAVFSAGDSLNTQYYNKAQELKEKLQTQRYKCDVSKIQVWRLEWIAQHDNVTSIRKLINHKKLGSWDKESRFWKDPKAASKLQVFTGTVIQSSHPLKGTIILDVVQSQYKCRIEVYFVPKLYELDQSRFGEQRKRVEFCIGFSCKHGAEAFSVKLLEKHLCSCCKTKTEFITINAVDQGACGICGTGYSSSPSFS